jgi:hypothetical protein
MKSHTHRFRVAKLPPTTSNIANSTNTEDCLRPGGTSKACNRCRLLKKKCSKTSPTCELCMSGGHICSLGQLAGRQNASPTTTTPNVALDTVLRAVASETPQEQRAMQRSSPRTVDYHAHNAAATASTFDGTYLSYAHAYFRHVHRAYPFLDRQEILNNAKASAYLNVWADNSNSIVSALDQASSSL